MSKRTRDGKVKVRGGAKKAFQGKRGSSHGERENLGSTKIEECLGITRCGEKISQLWSGTWQDSNKILSPVPLCISLRFLKGRSGSPLDSSCLYYFAGRTLRKLFRCFKSWGGANSERGATTQVAEKGGGSFITIGGAVGYPWNQHGSLKKKKNGMPRPN